MCISVNHIEYAGLSVHLDIIQRATRMLNSMWKDSNPITTQSSPAVTHCTLAAIQYTCPEGLEC
jgi:hypothetical protein